MAGIDVRLDYFPLVWIVNHEGTTDADYVALLATLTRLVNAGDEFVVLAEGTGMAFPSASQRKVIAEWVPTVKGRMERCSLGTAMVMSSSIQRGAITALNWLMRPDVPTAAFDTKDEALPWLHDKLVKANVPISSALAKLIAGAGAPVSLRR